MTDTLMVLILCTMVLCWIMLLIDICLTDRRLNHLENRINSLNEYVTQVTKLIKNSKKNNHTNGLLTSSNSSSTGINNYKNRRKK